MSPIKALRLLREAQDGTGLTKVTILLPTGKVIRGLIVDIDTSTDAIGAPGEMVAGRTRVELRVDLGS